MVKLKLALGMAMACGAGAATAAKPGLDWLAGQWCGGSGERQIDEVWLPEAGGALLGMSRTVRAERTESFEFMRIVPKGKDAGLYVQPNGVAPTVFTLASEGEGWVVFENPAHDFPNRIAYRRDGAELRAVISGPGQDGKTMQVPFEYRRCEK